MQDIVEIHLINEFLQYLACKCLMSHGVWDRYKFKITGG